MLLTETGGLQLITDRLLGIPRNVVDGQLRLMLPVVGVKPLEPLEIRVAPGGARMRPAFGCLDEVVRLVRGAQDRLGQRRVLQRRRRRPVLGIVSSAAAIPKRCFIPSE